MTAKKKTAKKKSLTFGEQVDKDVMDEIAVTTEIRDQEELPMLQGVDICISDDNDVHGPYIHLSVPIDFSTRRLDSGDATKLANMLLVAADEYDRRNM